MRGRPIGEQIGGVSFLKVLAAVAGLLVSGALLLAFLAHNHAQSRAKGAFVTCKAHLTNLGTALEMYAKDHDGSYPGTLQELVPEVMPVLPQCIAPLDKSGHWVDTYSESYRMIPKEGDRPASFSFFCQGTHHEGFAPPRAC